ncbi:MAG: type IV toxin-antitoxin system AbiEi family antitoxin domain-containing protein [Acidimicrobiales bacterium]
MDADRILADIASAQHSVVSRRQAVEAGVSRSALDRRLATGRLLQMHAGVYRLDGHAGSWHRTLTGAVLATGSGSAVSHRGAAFLHRLAGIDPRAEVSVAAGRAPRPHDVLVHRVVQLGRPDVGSTDAIPCTRPARTLIDLAAVVGPASLEIALDDALSRRLITVGYLRGRIDALGRQGRGGVGTLVHLLEARIDGRPRTQSEFERRLLRALRDGGLPAPRTQYEVSLPDGRKAYLDIAYPEVMLALEADSYRHHSSRLDWARDRTRNSLVIALGWRILPVTWGDLVPDPSSLVALIARGLNAKPRYAGKTVQTSSRSGRATMAAG